MRYLYSLILLLALPILFVRLWWRGKHNRDYRQRWSERLGVFPRSVNPRGIWLHAVSLGEAIAAAPLIKALRASYPDKAIIVTTTTPTGSAYVSEQFKEQVVHAYLPFDLSFLINRFLKETQPILGIIMETELWPNLLHTCYKKNIPLILANARLSARSAKGYHRIRLIVTRMLNNFTYVIAQSELDGQRFLALGLKPEKLLVSGNIKFDLQLNPNLKEEAQNLRQYLAKRLVWTAASTHEGEEKILLESLLKLREKHPELLLIIAPRHADRFEQVAELCVQSGFKMARRSLGELPAPDTEIYLCDTFGEMMLLYAVSDFAFVGGSLIPHGGHNLIEPASLGLAILSGPELHNFTQVSELLLAENALKIVQNVDDMSKSMLEFIENPSATEAMGLRALAVADANRGALEKHQSVIASLVNKLS